MKTMNPSVPSSATPLPPRWIAEPHRAQKLECGRAAAPQWPQHGESLPHWSRDRMMTTSAAFMVR